MTCPQRDAVAVETGPLVGLGVGFSKGTGTGLTDPYPGWARGTRGGRAFRQAEREGPTVETGQCPRPQDVTSILGRREPETGVCSFAKTVIVGRNRFAIEPGFSIDRQVGIEFGGPHRRLEPLASCCRQEVILEAIVFARRRISAVEDALHFRTDAEFRYCLRQHWAGSQQKCECAHGRKNRRTLHRYPQGVRA